MPDISFAATHIIIIDAIPDDELQNGIKLEQNISDSINRCDSPALKVERYKCMTQADLIKILSQTYILCRDTETIPIFHIFGHGSEQSLSVADGTEVEWEIIFDRFRDINIVTKNNLLVTSGACRSSWAYRYVPLNKRSSVFGLLAPSVKISAGDAIDSFSAFYKALIEDNSFEKAMTKLVDIVEPKTFTLILSQMFFDHEATIFIKKSCMGKEKQKDKEALITLLREDRSISLKEARKEAINLLKGSLPVTLKKMHSKFMMTDIYPETKSRFPFNAKKFENSVRKNVVEVHE